jgi:UDP-2,3-diacylglucosamine pyrophosphatase LpxH
MIIAVSDIHLGDERSDYNSFKSFINSELKSLGKNDHFILLGDILEFWRKKNLDSIVENQIILKELSNLTDQTNVYYIYGNHDYTVLNLANKVKNFPFKVSHDLRLELDNKKYYFLHGYELEVYSKLEPLTLDDYEKLCVGLCDRTENHFGSFLSVLWDLSQMGNIMKDLYHTVTKPPTKRDLGNSIDKMTNSFISKSMLLGVEQDEFFIFGHTHIPKLDKINSWGNTGSWLTNEKEHNIFIKINENEILLIRYPNEILNKFSL